ncbi:hypothetical protein SAMN04487905_10273 [Actinopolyspora xinjiangensis]|uniref:Excreted virulence factor EspC, type VII ESX diderm n=1 Tax=Actinopolyspora xinjiangensis TaxID=405564 RepID=A0A1H0Q6E6_9ACTN|nr:hypothetical protein [Actinopolyspora xinjiangensis]SDP12199.1 hypothetical protein SAMN04487905_10273 [Actinopolyspora xinjiangensis]
MGRPNGSADYDGEAMKRVARSTEQLADAFNAGTNFAESIDSGEGTFGRVGRDIGVGATFETVCQGFSRSLGKAREHLNELAGDIRSSFTDMESRDQDQAENVADAGKGE